MFVEPVSSLPPSLPPYLTHTQHMHTHTHTCTHTHTHTHTTHTHTHTHMHTHAHARTHTHHTHAHTHMYTHTHTAKKSFYRYALFLSLVNVVQAVGSMLWFTGKHRPASGHAGIWYIATV